MRTAWIFLTVVVAGLAPDATKAHELWLHPRPGSDSTVIRPSFGDRPDLGADRRPSFRSPGSRGPEGSHPFGRGHLQCERSEVIARAGRGRCAFLPESYHAHS